MFTYPLRNLINLLMQKVVVGIKMLLAECGLTYEFIGHFTLQVHHQFQHLVIGLPRKHDLASVQLEDGRSD